MDMGIRLNLSYPVAKPVSETAAAERGQAQSKVADTATAQADQVVQATTDSKASEQQMQQSDDKLKAAAQEIQDFFQSVKRNLEFAVDDCSGKVVVKVIASDSGEVIRQIPNEEVLKLAESLSDASSMLFRAKA